MLTFRHLWEKNENARNDCSVEDTHMLLQVVLPAERLIAAFVWTLMRLFTQMQTLDMSLQMLASNETLSAPFVRANVSPLVLVRSARFLHAKRDGWQHRVRLSVSLVVLTELRGDRDFPSATFLTAIRNELELVSAVVLLAKVLRRPGRPSSLLGVRRPWTRAVDRIRIRLVVIVVIGEF